MSNYLRNRPFMVVSYRYALAEDQKSQNKGFMETAEWAPVENMVIVDRIKQKQLNDAELILDLLENKVIKCRDNTLDHEKLFKVFVSRHYGEVKEALALWISKNPDNLAKVQDFVEKFTNKEIEDGE